MTRSNSTDNGPGFITDLIREMGHLRRQQEGTERKLMELSQEHARCERRLEAIENTLRAIGCRETDLAEAQATAEGRRLGQRNLLTTLLPVAVLLAGWFLSLTWFAIQHATKEESQWKIEEQRTQQGPPVPDRLHRK